MKIVRQKIEARCGGVEFGQLLRWTLTGIFTLWLVTVPVTVGGGVASVIGSGKRGCQKIVLRGQVAAGQQWRAAVGAGWVFRVIPIVSPPRIAGGRTEGPDYTGWDLVMDREKGDGYPDALLLATPPYGSLNEREIGTTFGMRAQDAIAWEPRRFHFFTSTESVAHARSLFRQVMPGGAADRSAKAVNRNANGNSEHELLTLIASDTEMGHGNFSITAARLVAGSGDPPSFAASWAAHLSRVPHTLEQASPQAFANSLGQLRSIQFEATLWLPGKWKPASSLRPEAANCAE